MRCVWSPWLAETFGWTGLCKLAEGVGFEPTVPTRRNADNANVDFQQVRYRRFSKMLSVILTLILTKGRVKSRYVEHT